MSFKTTLKIEDNQFKILQCRYEFSQNIDHKSKPSARPQGGQITVLVESTSDNFLVDWATSETQVKNGRIIFYKRDSIAKMKKVIFTDVYGMEFAEDFNPTDKQPLQIELMLSA